MAKAVFYFQSTIKLTNAEDNSFLPKAILDSLSLYLDLEVKFHGFNGLELLEKLDKKILMSSSF
jgi:hypothetical protein